MMCQRIGLPPISIRGFVFRWLSSLILLATIAKQIHKQWQDRSSKGVSKWLFIGQMAASCGFTAYSFLVHNWVFVATNALMAISAMVGLLITRAHRRQAGRNVAASPEK